MGEVEVPERTLPGEREVPLGSDMVAFLVICPPLEAMLCTFGLWIIGLMLHPLGTIAMTILFGSFPALASLVAARCRRTGYLNVPMAPGFGAAGAMAIMLMVSGFLSEPGTVGFGVFCTASAFLCGQIAYGVARTVTAPRLAAAIVLGPLALWCLVHFLLA